ncbi:MAG: hypothetical protein ACHQRM_16325 [Bacteroidia bacterium]
MKTIAFITLFILTIGFAGNTEAATERYHPYPHAWGFRPCYRPALVIAPPVCAPPSDYYAGNYYGYYHRHRGHCCEERREHRECHRHRGYHERW